jgi:hypothetical protein
MQLRDLTYQQVQEQTATDFARYVKCFATTPCVVGAGALFVEQYPHALSIDLVKRSVELYTKAASAPGDTTNVSWAKPLVNVPALTDAFTNLLRPREVVSQLQGVLRVPPGVPVPVYTPQALSGATVWLGQGAPKRVAAFAFTTATVPRGKAALITVVTKELLKFGVAGTEGALKEILAGQVVNAVNQAFLDPANVAVPDVNPGSVTAAGTSVTTANNPVTDANAVLAALVAARPNVVLPTLIMDASAASALVNTGNQPGLTLAGGTGLGAQVIVSGAAGKTITALDTSALLLSDNGFVLDMSDQATIALDDAPTPPTAGTIVTPLWSQNYVAFKAERLVSWKLTDATACQYSTRA